MRYEKVECVRTPRSAQRIFWIYGLLGLFAILLIVFLVNEKNWRPVKGKPHWIARANYNQELAWALIDRNIETVWTSLAPATSGMFIEIDLSISTVINGVVLQSEKKGIARQPEGLIVKVSPDGQRWQTVARQRVIAYKSFFVLAFAPPVNARYLQVIEPSVPSSGDPWIIHELDVLQPITPWQFRRSTLLNAIIGVLLAIGSLLIRWERIGQSVWLKPALMLVILLAGWSLRVAMIPLTQISAQDLKYLFVLDAETSTDSTWIVKYVQHTQTGVVWLSLLLMRWWYRLYADYCYALRMTSALSGVGVIGLTPFIWKQFLAGKETWKPAVFAAALISVSGLPMTLLHRSDFSGALLLCILLYLLGTFRFFYQRSSYLWVMALGLLLLGAFFIAPGMHVLPLGISIFVGLHRLIRWQRGHREPLREFMLRYGLYAVSCVPVGGYLLMTRLRYDWPSPVVSFAVDRAAIRDLLRAVELSGFIGIPGWILWGLALIGIGHVLQRRSVSAGFFYSQGLLLFLFAPDKSIAPGLPGVMAIFFVCQGLQSGYALLRKRLTPVSGRWLPFAAYLLIFCYMGGFAVNSLLVGDPRFPHDPSAVQQLHEARALRQTIDQIRVDQNDCKELALVGDDLAEMYAVAYQVHARYRFDGERLQRRMAQRLFPTYLWAIDPGQGQSQVLPLTEGLQPHYDAILTGQSGDIYMLRREFWQSPKRYFWRDLHRGVGETTGDKESLSGAVGYARPGEQPPGLLSFGPYTPVCADGDYIARFALRAKDLSPDPAPIAILEAVADTYTVLARRELTGNDFPDSNQYYSFDLPFTLDVSGNPALPMKRLQFFVHFTGQVQIRLDYIDLIPPM